MDHIIEGVYLGDMFDAHDVLTASRPPVRAVLNVADEDCEAPARPPGVAYLHLPLEDGIYCPPEVWQETTSFIRQHRHSVLVHCRAGMSRSVVAVMAYLVRHHDFTLEQAYAHLAAQRGFIGPSHELLRSLVDCVHHIWQPEGKARNA